MALLQIDDPVAGPRAIGIDLGTTHSLVAYVTPVGAAVTLHDCDDEALVPSVVHYKHDGSCLVGQEAKAFASTHPGDTIVSVKRFMGRGADDPQTRDLSTHRFATHEGPVVRFAVARGRVVTPVEVSAEILGYLRKRATETLGEVAGAVITVPAYFDDAQRQATKDAGSLAGLEVLRLLNEPTAAALAYGLESKQNGTFAIYDLGGGTFDITILSLDDGVFQVRSTGGDSQLGGDDMDRALAVRLLGAMSYPKEAAAIAPDVVQTALDTARAAKHALTEQPAVDVVLKHADGSELTERVLRSELEMLIGPLLDRTGLACKRALRDADLTGDRLDGVILVGGATRMPAVRRYVAQLFGREPLADIDPDQVVALGAALQADLLAGEVPRDDVLLLDVLPLSLGIEAMGGVAEKILPRNASIPTEAAQVFTTYADGQTGFELHVVQGERELAADCRPLAHFTLKGIPPMPAGTARLEVRFHVDADSILHVSAKELTTGIEQHVEVTPSYGLSDEHIERMLLDAYEHAEQDVAARALREKRVEAERISQATRTALAADADLVPPQESQRIEQALQDLARASEGTSHGLITDRIEALDAICRPFAGRRMDRSIRRALAGRAVGDVEQETQHATGIEAHLPEAMAPLDAGGD
ncbi:MAG: Fe-S protein assembly chaperone HscA [Proteobacteria bacterium]|nr:Fe-S protein assembly chaperone HscA [Pseudomonadota bacterium]